MAINYNAKCPVATLCPLCVPSYKLPISRGPQNLTVKCSFSLLLTFSTIPEAILGKKHIFDECKGFICQDLKYFSSSLTAD